jgi:hypothetical protein
MTKESRRCFVPTEDECGIWLDNIGMTQMNVYCGNRMPCEVLEHQTYHEEMKRIFDD